MPSKTKFAEGTNVSPARSREELQALLKKYGAAKFGYIDQDDAAVVGFEMRGRTYRFILRLPPVEDYRRTSRNIRT